MHKHRQTYTQVSLFACFFFFLNEGDADATKWRPGQGGQKLTLNSSTSSSCKREAWRLKGEDKRPEEFGHEMEVKKQMQICGGMLPQNRNGQIFAIEL